ncbi:amino acid ABC transporter ATP-binding protein [Paracoccaceae bacterium Fryx2]|nr:amino acid ABC transporter ATP-binding protein [Paracoccaceae bacterium Fryx2]
MAPTLLPRAAEPIVQIESLRKRFGTLEVLRGVSLSAGEGQVISILGSSGSGKSTLLRCVNLLETADGGVVRVGPLRLGFGADAEPAPAAERRKLTEGIRRQTGMVFQNFNLWSHKTVLQNVIEAPVHVFKRPRAEVIGEAEALLEKVGLIEKRDAYPAMLSGGQQQRAAIARALAMRPKVLLFDEPTSALDPELVGEVLRVIRDLASEARTMLVVTHEVGFAREVSDRVVFLDAGRIEAEGTPDEVFSRSTSPRFRQFISRVM